MSSVLQPSASARPPIPTNQIVALTPSQVSTKVSIFHSRRLGGRSCTIPNATKSVLRAFGILNVLIYNPPPTTKTHETTTGGLLFSHQFPCPDVVGLITYAILDLEHRKIVVAYLLGFVGYTHAWEHSHYPNLIKISLWVTRK